MVIDGDRVGSSLPIDSGGIGKGLAADLVAERLVERGALGALVNVGGDLRCAGSPPSQRWQIHLNVPIEVEDDLSVRLDSGAVCTSTPLKRRWETTGGGVGHHLLDPRTGRPAADNYASVSVIAPRAWLAEVLSKAVFLMPAPSAQQLLRSHRAGAVVVTMSGGVAQL